MKKIYLCAMALSVGSLSFGQSLTQKSFSSEKHQRTADSGIKASNNVSINSKAPGDVIYSEDFNGQATLPAGWSEVDNTGNGAPWVVEPAGTLPDADFTTGQTTIASTSGGNCMLYYSDGYQSPPPPSGYYDVDAYFQTGAIPLNNVNGVSVNFQQSFRNCCANSGVVAVLMASTDPAFPVGPNTESYDIIGGVATNVASADPMDVSVNISSIAAGVTGDIYLRWHIGAGIEAYYWMIDDIEVVESVTNDITTQNGFYGFFGVQYTSIPYEHVQDMDVSMQYNNIGTADQTNSSLNVDINDGSSSIFTMSSTPATIASLEADTITMDAIWTPSVLPSDWNTPYTVTLDISSADSTDASPANNQIVFNPFVISQNIMALDDFSTTPGNGGSNPGPGGVTEYEAGNQFDIIVNDDLMAIDVVTGTNTPVGTFVDVVIYLMDLNVNPTTYTEVWRSQGYQVTAGDLGVVKSFIPTTPIALTGGETYFAAVHSFVDYEFGISGLNPPAGTPSARHSGIAYPSMSNPNASSTFGYTNTPMIRLNFDLTTDVDLTNETTEFSVFPNPSKGIFTINLDADAAKTANISVKNVVGQTIINKTVNVAGKTTETLSLTDYSKGVYFLTIDNKTVKLVVE